MQQLIFLIGISGSGKSTYIKSHFIPEVIVSPDDLRKKLTGDISDQSQNGKIWGMVPKLLKEKMEQYGKAVLDATNVDSGDRAKILKDFDRKEVERIAVVFDTDPEEAKKRIHKDIESGKDRSNVPDNIIDRQYEKFKRGYKSIKQQFDKVIDGNKGRSEMKEEYLRKIVAEEMKAILQEDALDATEEQNYKVYQDMYITPQSNWKQKKYVPMLSAKGKTYNGKLGEIHKIQTVEYDLFHHGEVVTECGGETYSIDSDDFRNGFEMVNDEEGLNITNESSQQSLGESQYLKVIKKKLEEAAKIGEKIVDWNIKIKTDGFFGENDREFLRSILLFEYNQIMSNLSVKYFKTMKHIENAAIIDRMNNDIAIVDVKIFPSVKPFFIKWLTSNYHIQKVYSIGPTENIKEEVKKLVKIKDYFGKNIKESIEKLEEVFFNDKFVIKNIMNGKKYYASRVNQHGSIDQWETVSNPFSNDNILKFTAVEVADILNTRSKWISDKIRIVDEKGKEMKEDEFMKEYYGGHGEPEDAYLDQDFEDRISGTEDYGDMYEAKLQKEISARDRLGYENDWARKNYRQYMIFYWYKNSYKYYNESYNTIKEAQDRIEELQKDKFNKQMQFFIVDRKTKKRVPEKDLNLEKIHER